MIANACGRALRLLPCLLWLLCVCGTARAAEAELPPRTVMVNAPPSDALLAQAALRASAELRAAGFQVQRGECADTVDVPCGQPVAAGGATVAVLVLQRSGETVTIDVRLARAGSDDPIALRRDLRSTTPTSLEPAAIGVCASELVHASLTASVRPPSPSLLLVSPFLEAGAAGLVSVGMGYGVGVRAGLLLGPAWALSLRAVAVTSTPIQSSTTPPLFTIPVAGREFEVIPQLAVSRRWRQDARLQPELSVGAGVHYLRTTGEVKTARAWTPFVAGGAGLGWKLANGWTLHADLQALFLQDFLDVVFTDPNRPVSFPNENSGAGARSWSVLPMLNLAIEPAL